MPFDGNYNQPEFVTAVPDLIFSHQIITIDAGGIGIFTLPIGNRSKLAVTIDGTIAVAANQDVRIITTLAGATLVSTILDRYTMFAGESINKENYDAVAAERVAVVIQNTGVAAQTLQVTISASSN